MCAEGQKKEDKEEVGVLSFTVVFKSWPYFLSDYRTALSRVI